MDAKAVRRIRQLCCLGIDRQMLLPALLRELHALVPSYSSGFFFTDHTGRFVNLYDESPEAQRYAARYVSEFLDKRDLEIQPSFSAWVRTGADVTTSERYVFGDLYRSALYHEILRPLNYHSSMVVAVNHNGHPIGLLLLHRSRADPRFRAKEERSMSELIPYFAHGLGRREEVGPTLVESDVEGLMLFERNGELAYVSREARRLLFLAGNPIIYRPDVGDTGFSVPPQVIELYRRCLMAIEERDTPPAPPVWRHRNAWGGFVFRAYGLTRPDQSGTGAIAISIHYQEPVALRLARRGDELGLTTKQSEICRALATGYSYKQIAARMHVSEHTVIDHVRKIYTRLEVKNRSKLLAKLLAN